MPYNLGITNKEAQVMVHTRAVSESLQDYLETILSLAQDGEGVRVTDIASRLQHAKASVSQALRLLKEKGLIEQERYGLVNLTPEGREYAYKISYRHDVLRFFLIEVLQVPREIAERDACLLEHDLSKETFDNLLAFLRRHNYDVSPKGVPQNYNNK